VCDETDNCFVAKVREEVLSHFHAVAVKGLGSMQNWLSGLPGRILCDVKQNEHALDLALHLSRPFPVSVNFDSPYTANAFFLERLSNQCQGLRRTFSEIYT
jgi:hypothetical protein